MSSMDLNSFPSGRPAIQRSPPHIERARSRTSSGHRAYPNEPPCSGTSVKEVREVSLLLLGISTPYTRQERPFLIPLTSKPQSCFCAREDAPHCVCQLINSLNRDCLHGPGASLLNETRSAAPEKRAWKATAIHGVGLRVEPAVSHQPAPQTQT